MANRVEISKRLIFINSLAGIALGVANVGVLVWLYRHLLHRISQEEFALYPVVTSVTAFLPLLTVVLSSGLGRYTLVAYAQADERRVGLSRYLDMDRAVAHVLEMLPLIRRHGDLPPRERVRQIERLLEGY